MRKILLLLLILPGINAVQAQTCIPTTINGTVITLSCGTPCTNFSYQVPHLKATTDYTVGSIPFASYANNGGTTIPSTYVDDKYSPLIPIVFPFCFYGQTYNNMVVGSNGIVTFEALCANADNAFTLDVGGVPQPIPYNGGAGPGGIFTTYYPRTAIMGAYYDIDPSASPLPTRRVEYRVFGQPPCRKLVISFVDVKLFSCTNLIHNSQIVLYESTGLIDIFLADKPNCPSWNSGLGILGIQDETRLKAVAAPGKNCTQWSESNTGYRFTPNGGVSNFVNAQLFTVGGTFLANGDTATTIPGILDINFPTICPPNNPSTQYVIKTTFNSCTGVPLTSSDTITFNRVNSLPATITMNPTTCGTNVGSVTVTPTAGTAPYTYTLNGGAPVNSPGAYTFTNLAAGPYTVVVTDVNGCTNTLNITVTTTTSITANISATATSCPLSADGTITVTPTSGTAPYSYSLDGGPGQPSGTFTNVAAGPHTVVFTDAMGCTGTVSINVVAGSTPLTANISSTATSCPTASNGTITVTPTSGSPAYQYSLDGGANQPGNVFTNVGAGPHSVRVTDAFGCTGFFPINVAAGPNLTANISSTATSCPAVNNGTITVSPTSGLAPYQYSLDGGPNQPGNVFSNVASGLHSVTFTDALGCTGTVTINVAAGPALTANISSTATSCPAVNNGTITVTPTSGSAPYQYSLDGGPNQPGNVFSNVAAGFHSVTFTDAIGCTGTVTINVAAGAALTANINSTATSCPAVNNGTITITPTSGSAPYQYSLDGGPNQPGNIFTNVAPGPHSVTFTDAIGCTGTVSTNVAVGPALTATISSTPTSCPTVSDGTITATPTNGTAPYQYSLDAGPNQPGNIFTNVTSGAHNVMITDANGCTNNFPVNVVQGTGLTSTITPVNPPCNNINNGTITINPTSGTGPYQYSLNGGPPQGSNVFTGLAPGPYTITFTDAIGCSGTNNTVLTTNTAITATSTNVMPLCNGVNNGSITLNASGGVSPYQYSINGGSTYQASPTFAGLAAGTYNFVIKDALGCIYNFSFVLNQPAGMTASAVSTQASCANNDGTVTVTANGGTPAYEYSINNGLNYQVPNIFAGLAIGNYNNIRIRDANGCIANTTVTVTLNDTMRLELGPDTTVCFGTPVTLMPQTNNETDTFKWTPAAGLDYDTARNPVATPLDTTKYYLLAKWGACQRIDSIRVNILHKPFAHAGNDTTICYKTNATLNGWATNLSGSVNYSWTPPDSLNTPNAASTIARMDTTRQFTLTVTDNYGCNFSVSDSMWVIMQPVVPAFAGNDTIAMLNKPHQLMGSGAGPGGSYLWSPAGPLDNPFIQNPKAVLSNDTYFTLLVTDAIGCTAEDGVFITVYEGPEYYVPNAFTPNGDGLNDIFRPIPSGMRSTSYFRVFNRFGQLVFETNKWLEGWDGRFKGKDSQQGTYVWTIKGYDVNGREVEMQGTVILLR